MRHCISLQIAAEGSLEEGFLQLVEGIQLALVKGFKPLPTSSGTL
jgi:hypothetical protein